MTAITLYDFRTTLTVFANKIAQPRASYAFYCSSSTFYSLDPAIPNQESQRNGFDPCPFGELTKEFATYMNSFGHRISSVSQCLHRKRLPANRLKRATRPPRPAAPHRAPPRPAAPRRTPPHSQHRAPHYS
ncbi:hypothetical protein EVAR_86409_1 [Eumeta japonica]|uniref:Uncharacterized protein n=1 Tax=Eumeta variegata TaxID=151549 RepID=A0A4C1WAE7_EUMVA|nr:hypothetical protein EVAR_86409_1 [Eumeta japonica]